jgi:hypothetical protein
MEHYIMQINGYFLNVEVLQYNKRVPQTWSEPEEPEHYDIGEVTLISNPTLDYDQIERFLEVDDLWNEINYLLLDKK